MLQKPQFCAPEDEQKFARNMLSWSWRSINCYCCILLVSILPYLHWRCTVKHKSSHYFVFVGKTRIYCSLDTKLPMQLLLQKQALFKM